MRGPSSSHTAASWRIAKTCLMILNEDLKEALIEFDKDGAWAPNFREQGTALGIDGGLLGLDIIDDRIKNTEDVAKEKNININYKISSFPTKHANTVKLSLLGTNKKIEVVAVSLGGGAFEIQKINNLQVSIKGDSYQLFIKGDKEVLQNYIDLFDKETCNYKEIEDWVNVKSYKQFDKELLKKFSEDENIENILIINPVLPIILGKKFELPFNDITSMIKYAESNNIKLSDIALEYEKSISGFDEVKLNNLMQNLYELIDKSINVGLNGTYYKDRILQQQSHLIKKAENENKILKNSIINNIAAYVMAIMESKSAMEVIVANPTAGSCGAVGGVIKAVADELGSTKEEIVKAYFASGIIGVFFAEGPGFSAEEHGCQVECGASAGMAAAAIVELFGGTVQQGIDAASMAIQNVIGLVCDPVADRVEVPCLGKNINAAVNALASATLACSGVNAVIPLNEVIETVSRVSAQMPSCNKCTGKGGLALTNTSKELKQKLSCNC